MKHLRPVLALIALSVAIALPATAAPRGPDDGEVLSVAITHSPGNAEIVIGIRGAIQVKDFLLANPDRLVLDLSGAHLTAALALYDGIERAGIRNIRYGQFTPEIVRVVIDLTEQKNYTLETSAAGIRVRFSSERAFVSWSSLAPAELPVPETATARAATGRAPEVNVGGAALQQQPTARRITVTWDNATIADVAAGFASFSGRSIILGTGIDPAARVTAELKDIPWPDAFRAVLGAQGLSAQEMPGGVIRIDSPSQLAKLDSLEPLETRLVRVNYANAASISKNLAGLLTRNRGTVVADSATNGLIITDTRSHVETVMNFVKNLDVPTPMVSIQAKIILVDREDINALGIQYDIGAPDPTLGSFFNTVVQRGAGGEGSALVDLGGTSVAGVGNTGATMTDAALRLLATTSFGNYALTAFLDAVQTLTLGDVQAEPLITTLDNVQADLLVGEETPVRIIDAGTAGSGGATSTAIFKPTGIRLTVTPHVTNNRNVLLDIYAERSALQELAAADLGYNFQKQTARSRVLVDDGETAVIGGLTLTSVTRVRTGIPYLSALPGIGNLFAYNRTRENRRDLIILVTPRVIESPAMAAAAGQ